VIATCLDAPIVLLHGLCGFDRIGLGRFTVVDYFRRVPEAMRAAGNVVIVPRVHPIAGTGRRVADLARQIELACPEGPIHIIGHSMGGLDARFMLDDLTWRRRVLSLTTIGTPHRGTALADVWGMRLGLARQALLRLRLDHDGLLAVTRRRARAFDRAHPEPRGVACFSIAGNPEVEDVCWPMRPFHRELGRHEGPNDGLVPMESALGFGETLPPWPIDHLRQMNWFARPRCDEEHEPLALYESCLRRLAELGHGEAVAVGHRDDSPRWDGAPS
jgi:triacylglycerol lipase